ncbi:MAG: hypothetical protein DHS20C05_23800 [Hyphococcus sp.]|nr:MAG: hypothetical protein DHS20C05_23800 [Marinicaulis sp.]
MSDNKDDLLMKNGAGRVWVLTDGKIGDDVQCLAVAEALAPDFDKRVITPRAPWVWMAPWGPIDPRDAPSNPDSPIAKGPGNGWPNLVVASGRRAIPYARAVKKVSNGKCFVVIMKDPRVSPSSVDLIWAPVHDKLTGANVVTTLTSPHGLARPIADARDTPTGPISELAKPMLGVVLGGPSGGARFDDVIADDLIAKIRHAKGNFASLALTPSRRTPDAFLKTLKNALTATDTFIWDRSGDNPYVDILAHSDALIVTADSHNMMSEAVSTGAGVYAFRPPGLAKKMAWFVDALESKGAVRNLEKCDVEPIRTTPIDATDEIVEAIKQLLS